MLNLCLCILMKTPEKRTVPPVIPVMEEPVADAGSQGWVYRFGQFLKQHGGLVACVQWGLVVFYLALLAVPAITGNPEHERLSRLVLWGIGWPCIVLSMLLFGRFWCGLFCPDGTLTEAVSYAGPNRSIPKWMRWKWLPCAVLVVATLYGQSFCVYADFSQTLVFLGVPTALAVLCGLLTFRGRRIWCMYLCPGNGFFSLVARLSFLHFAVDKAAWKAWKGPAERVNCAPLVNMQQMTGMSDCHACGRCHGYRGAIELKTRKPWDEMDHLSSGDISNAEAFMMLWGVVGICLNSLAVQKSVVFHYVLRFVNWLEIGLLPPLGLPWMRFLATLLLGTVVSIVVYLLLKACERLQFVVSWKQLVFALIPIAGWGIFVGVFREGLSVWQEYGFVCGWFPVVEKLILYSAIALSLRLGYWMLSRFKIVDLTAGISYTLAVFLVAGCQLTLPLIPV